ncbi:MAG: DUF4157 domain-containing protein [Methanotrichaceae archaeon]|nr:DUF4157 domain-containing protein [Methanotrichaceae archaeon]
MMIKTEAKKEASSRALHERIQSRGEVESLSPNMINVGEAAISLQAMPPLQRAAAVQRLQRTRGNGFVTRIQAKMTVGPADDSYEQEADRVAERVMRMPDSQTIQHNPLADDLQRKPTAGSITRILRQVEPEEEEKLQLKGEGGRFSVPQAVESRLEARRGGGQPLSNDVRGFMEPRFGADFGNVRLHSDPEAGRLSEELGARAFTRGQDIYMGGGQDQRSDAGQRLIAHELTHVIQQGAAGTEAPGHQQIVEKSQSRCDTIIRWAEDEHRYFGDQAMARLRGNPNYANAISQIPDAVKSGGLIGVPYLKPTVEMRRRAPGPAGLRFGGMPDEYPVEVWEKDKMTYGQATMLGGDYSKTPEALAGRWRTLEPENLANISSMYWIAATNVNHFNPLASKEYYTQHNKAVRLAGEARAAANAGNVGLDRAKAEEAIAAEAFSGHFLMDTYASGHQVPHALTVVGDWKATQFARMPRLGLTFTKTYHDLLNALPNGLNLIAGGKFHGDNTRTAQDDRVAIETYHSLAEVISTMSGVDFGTPLPVANPGPDVPRILQDPAARPIWLAMMEKAEPLYRYAETEKEQHYTTSSEQTGYSRSEIAMYWRTMGEPVISDPRLREEAERRREAERRDEERRREEARRMREARLTGLLSTK